MTNPSRFGWVFHTTRLRSYAIALLLLAPLHLAAQDHDDDHEHGHLHFSHPLVTESPSPDTKLRFDYILDWSNETPAARENTIRVEGEYAFTHSVSLAVVTPFTFRNSPSTDRANGIGNVELSLKAASLRYGEQGLLLGGGFSVGIPTGSDAKGIGSSHLVELEPFVDAGYKKEHLELVGFARMSSTVNRRASEELERNLGLDFSALYAVRQRLESLVEFTTDRPLVGAEKNFTSFVAPGVKIYPFSNRQVMFGASLALGVGSNDARAAMISGFYHF